MQKAGFLMTTLNLGSFNRHKNEFHASKTIALVDLIMFHVCFQKSHTDLAIVVGKIFRLLPTGVRLIGLRTLTVVSYLVQIL